MYILYISLIMMYLIYIPTVQNTQTRLLYSGWWKWFGYDFDLSDFDPFDLSDITALGCLCGRLDWARPPSQTSRGTSTSATWTGTPWRTGPSSQSLCLPSKTLKWASFVNLYNFQLCWNLYLIIFMHTGHRLLWQGVHRQGPEQSQRWQRHRGLTGLWEVLWRGLRGIQFLQHKLRALIASFSER